MTDYERKQRELDAYRNAVITLFNNKSTKQIDNGFPEHAAILYEQFFLNAEDRVRIFCKNLSRVVFDSTFVIDAARKALARGITIDVVLQEAAPESLEFYSILALQGMTPIHAKNKESRNAQANFSVMDRLAFRYERNREKTEAVACMYDPDIALALVNKFDTIKQAG